MPAQANANVIALQLEKVRDKVPLLYERDDILLTMIQQRGDVEKVSSRNMRLPLQVNPGGKAGSYNADGGDLGRGSGTQYDVAQVSPIFFRFAIEITKLVEYATNGRERAIENAAKREVANGMKQFRSFLDKLMQTGGNGVLGTINSIASTTFTMAVPSGAALVYVGQTIQVYDTTLTTNRGICTVTSADPINAQTVTVDVVPGGTVATDVIVHDGLSGAQPVSLFGIKYHQNAATTGTWLNLNRATYPVQLQTPRVNAGNAALTPSNVRLAINKVRKSLGINHISKLIAYMAVEQEHAWENLRRRRADLQLLHHPFFPRTRGGTIAGLGRPPQTLQLSDHVRGRCRLARVDQLHRFPKRPTSPATSAAELALIEGSRAIHQHPGRACSLPSQHKSTRRVVPPAKIHPVGKTRSLVPSPRL
jgi:hypothetical protein